MSESTSEEKEVAELAAEAKPEESKQEPEPENKGEGAESENQETEKKDEKSAAEVDDLESFIKEQGLAEESDGSDGGAKQESNTPGGISEEEIARRVEAARAEERESVNRTRQAEGVRNSFNNRSARIRAWGNAKIQKNEAVTQQDIEGLVQQFEQHHGQSQQIAKDEAATELAGAWSTTLIDAAEKLVPGVKAEAGKGTPAFVEAIVQKAREGYVSEADVKERVRKGLRDYKSHLDTKGLLQGTKELPAGSSSNGAGNRNPDAVMEDPNASADDKRKAFEDKHGFKPDW